MCPKTRSLVVLRPLALPIQGTPRAPKGHKDPDQWVTVLQAHGERITQYLYFMHFILVIHVKGLNICISFYLKEYYSRFISFCSHL